MKKGQNIGEWGLIVALVSVLSMVILFSLSDKLQEIGATLGNKLTQVSQQ